MKQWFSADIHNLHENIMRYCGRPFINVKEQEEKIFDNHNSLVKPNDIVYFLGDVAMTREGVISALKKMNGQIYFILGNHDMKFIPIIKQYCKLVTPLMDIKISGQKITLCHFAMRVWNCSHFGAWQLYGHSHGNLSPIGKQYDVGVDNNNFKPISFEEVTEIMKTKEQHHKIENGREIING